MGASHMSGFPPTCSKRPAIGDARPNRALRMCVRQGRVKWSADPVGLDVLRRLEGKVRLVERLGGRPVRFALVSRSGFRSEVRQEGESRGALLLDLRDLVSIFDERYGKPA